MNTNQKKGEVDFLVSDQADFRTWNIAKDNERQYVILKGIVNQDDISFQNV